MFGTLVCSQFFSDFIRVKSNVSPKLFFDLFIVFGAKFGLRGLTRNLVNLINYIDDIKMDVVIRQDRPSGLFVIRRDHVKGVPPDNSVSGGAIFRGLLGTTQSL